MKRLSKIVLMVLLLAVLVSCDKESGDATASKENNTKNEVVTIEFWHGFSTGITHEKMNEVVAYFESQHPNIKVNQTLVPWGEMGTKALTAVTAGNPPDVFRGWSAILVDWAHQGALTSLNDYIDKDSEFTVADFYPSVIEEATVQGEILGVSPSFAVNEIIFVNDDLLKKAGYDKMPSDFYEFKKMCEDIDNKADPAHGKPYAFMPWNLYNKLEGWVYALTGKLLYDYDNKVINLKEDPQVYNAAVEVFTWYKEVADRIGVGYATANCFVGGGTEEYTQRKSPANPFYQGEVLMWHGGLYNAADIEEFAPDMNYSMNYLPGVAQPDSSNIQSNFYFMPKGAKHPDETWEFLKFLSSDYFMENFVVYDTVVPARVKSANSETYADSPIVPLLDKLDRLAPPLQVLGATVLGSQLNNSTLDVLAGNITPEEAVDGFIEVMEMNVQ